MSLGRYLYSVNDNQYCIKMIGDLRYTDCANFDAFLNKIIDNENCTDIVIDLCDANFLDSTNLGLIAKAAAFVMRNFNHKMTLYSINENINYLLANTGFDNVLNINDSLLEENYLSEIPKRSANQQNLVKMLLEAHKALINLDDKNIAEFKDVVEMLEKENSQ